MRANRAYELIHRRGGALPTVLADPSRIDHLEVVEIDSGEVVLFWDLPVDAARQTARRLREDLANLQAEDFISTWGSQEARLHAE